MIRSLLTVLLVVFAATPAAAKDYRAERFTARIVAIENGGIRVTETIVFRFEDGTFTKVFRKVPTRRTDGIEFVSASMDGHAFPLGKGPGYVNMRRQEGLHFEWRFAQIGPSTHTFEVTYIVRGVVVTSGAGDVLAWKALPDSHEYRIDEATIDFVLPARAGTPVVRTRRVGSWTPDNRGSEFTITGRDIERNGWIEVTTTLPQGTLVTSPPQWQQKQMRYRAYRNRMLIIAGGVLLAGLIVLVALRQNYDTPPSDIPVATTFSGPPESLPPALAGALAVNGRAQIEHALATLFDLGARGVIQVNEGPSSWGSRQFDIVRRGRTHALAPHEQTVLDTIFGRDGDGDGVSLRKARSRLTTKFTAVRNAIDAELLQAGLIDPARRQVRSRYHVMAAVFIALSVVGAMLAGIQMDRIGPWLLTLPAAFLVLGIASVIFASAHTPLTNDGVRRAAQWRAYRKHLKDPPHGQSPASLLPFAVALGLGVAWAKLFKHRGAELPQWFHALSAADANRAFVAFVGTGGAGAHGGSGAGPGGAAGGGASGAG
jgi:hypothetical protein